MQRDLPPSIGLVTDSDTNRFTLHRLLQENDYTLSVSLDGKRLAKYFDDTEYNEPDAWLVDGSDEGCEQAISLLLEHSEQPLMLNEAMPPVAEVEAHGIWRRRLLKKLEEVAICSNNVESAIKPAVAQAFNSEIWVLAASIGGPDAVKRFLGKLPEDLPLAMVYVQHIEPNFDGVLTEAVGRRLAYPMQLAHGETGLTEGEILVVPVRYQLRFLPFGRVIQTRRPWEGIYQPSIDQVVAQLARIYREKLGVIIFSGMCSDGEVGCRVAKACGGEVWAQTPETCVSAAMPKAAIATGNVTRLGSPEDLAEALGARFASNAT